MQIRENGGRVQLLRSVYMKEKKRTQGKLIGSVPADAHQLPAELIEMLSEDEHNEFAAWMEKRIEAKRAATMALEVESLPQILQSVASHVMRGASLTAGQAKGIWEGTALLRRQLTKAGYTKNNLETEDVE